VHCHTVRVRNKRGDAMTKRLLFVFSNPVQGKDREFNDWYANTHLGEVVAVPNITSAQRYTLDETPPPESDTGGVAPPAHRYLTVYEVDGDPEVVLKYFEARMTSGDMTVSDALDM